MKGYPRLSETFIAQEILALQRAGVALEIWALRHPTDKAVHPMNQRDHARRCATCRNISTRSRCAC